MARPKTLSLLVTGSIAAEKRTLPLIDAFRKCGYDVTVIFTRAPLEWKWVDAAEAKAHAGEDRVFTDKDVLQKKSEALSASGTIVIAPASADFLSQLAYGNSELARAVLNAKAGGSRVVAAPAMNKFMFGHPVTQRNCAALEAKGTHFVGPVYGHQACGHDGFGRMVDEKTVVNAVAALDEGKSDPSASLFKEAQEKGKNPMPPRVGSDKHKVLVALCGGKGGWAELDTLIGEIEKAKLTVEYIVDAPWLQHRTILEQRTKSLVVTDHFKHPDLQGKDRGLEHIKMPGDAYAVFFPFLDHALGMDFLHGAGGSLCRDAFLASPVPVVTLNQALRNIPDIGAPLKDDGLVGIDSVADLARPPLRLAPACKVAPVA